MKSLPHWLSMCLDVQIKTVKIWTLTDHLRKFVWWWNRFRVCSARDEIVSTYAQPAHAIIFVKYPFSETSQQRNWFCVCSVIAKMFEHRNSGKKRKKRFEIFRILTNVKQSFDLGPKKFKTHACVPLKGLAIPMAWAETLSCKLLLTAAAFVIHMMWWKFPMSHHARTLWYGAKLGKINFVSVIMLC
jgi:hypothetical protein